MSDEIPGKKRIAVTTLGCKVNQFESAAFLSEFTRHPEVELVAFSESADIYVVNTCAVTARAGAQSRQLIRRALKTNPEARLVVTGCYAQVAAQEILEITDCPICIVGNAFKHRLVEVVLEGRNCDLEMHIGNIGGEKEITPLAAESFGERTRSFLRVQDGCNSFCSYCIVPYARGRSRSLAPAEALAQAENLAAQGYKELVLTGIHLGHYGHDLEPKTSLITLLSRLLKKNLPLRYRLSSLEPTEISEELLSLMAESPAIMPYLHIPLQSGDDRVLKLMNRRYRAAAFTEVVTNCLRYLPEAAIGADVLVGFPGEDEEAFHHTCALLASLPLSYLHVFPYSKRPGTKAAEMPDQVAKEEKARRVGLLKELDREKRQAFYRRNLGSIRQVLVEGGKPGRHLLKGFTDNYIPVEFAGAADLINKLIMVRLEEAETNRVVGRIL